MERYKCITGDDSLEEDDDGPYMLYTDAQAAVEALQARVQELEEWKRLELHGLRDTDTNEFLEGYEAACVDILSALKKWRA